MAEKPAQTAKDIFVEALEVRPDERMSFVADACDDDAIRAEVAWLLSMAEEAPVDFLVPAGDQAAIIDAARDTIGHSPTLAPGTLIDSYRVESVLGVGGMAVVYRAHQSAPVNRDVALKVIKPGMDSAAVIQRFNAERETLALMTHPSIARVLDAGIMDRGLPYFVVELVDGQPITHYSDHHRLDTRARLRLFLSVCAAIQHAHSKGIIHRDVKPGNVLVSDDSGEPLPKVIDFGIAKALGPALHGGEVTLYGQLLGTPEYMCPEQADPAIRDIDTRCDVYSLGALLYVLLSGALPIPRRVFEGLDPTQIRQVVLDREPTRPSARVEDSEDSDAIAAARSARADVLARQLRGELDWIVMKAVQKNRDLRYATVTEFAQDIERYLDDRPVKARPPSHLYACTKFVKRHRVETAVCAMIVMALLVLLGGLWFEHRSTQREAVKSATISAFLEDVLASQPDADNGRERRVADLLADASKDISRSFANEPEISARLQQTLGRAYLSLRMFEEASRELESALRHAETILGLEHPLTVSIRTDLDTAADPVSRLRSDE